VLLVVPNLAADEDVCPESGDCRRMRRSDIGGSQSAAGLVEAHAPAVGATADADDSSHDESARAKRASGSKSTHCLLSPRRTLP